jgi:hypothetical protein
MEQGRSLPCSQEPPLVPILSHIDPVRTRVSTHQICVGQSGTGTGFSPSSSGIPCHYHSTVAVHIHITWGMNNRLVGDRSSETQSHPIDVNNNIIRLRVLWDVLPCS